MWCRNSLLLSFVILAVLSHQGARGQEGAGEVAAETRAQAEKPPTRATQRIDVQIMVKEQQRVLVEKELTELEPQIAALSERLARIGRSSPEIKGSKARIENLREFLKRVSPQIDALKFELESPPTVQRVQLATASTTINELHRYAGAVGAGLAGFLVLGAVGLLLLRRRRAAVTAVALFAGAIFAGAAWWFWPETNRVVALLRVSRDTGSMVSTSGNRQTPEAYESNLRTQVSLLKGEFVLFSALRDPTISQLPLVRAESNKVGWLRDELAVENPRESELLQVSMRGEDPDQLVTIIDAVIDKYFTEHVDVERQGKLKKLARLTDAVREKEEELRAQNSKLQRLHEQIGPGGENWQTVQLLTMDHLRTMKSTQRELRQQRRKIDADLSGLQITREMAADPRGFLDRFEALPMEADAQLSVALFTALRELRDEVAALRNEIETLRKETAPSTETEPAPEQET